MSDFMDIYKYNPEYHRFADLMGVSRDDRDKIEVAKKLALIYDWAAYDTGKNDFESISQRVDKLRKEEGVSFSGKELTSFIYQKIRIHMDRVREANVEFEKRVKSSEMAEKYKVEKRNQEEWLKTQEDYKNSIAKKNMIAERELKKYITYYKKKQPEYDKVVKIEEAKPFDPQVEVISI